MCILELLEPQAVIAGFLYVYERPHRWKIFPWLENSHLSHVNSLISNRSFVYSAAFPQMQYLQALSTHPISPRYPFQVPGITVSLPKLAETEDCQVRDTNTK